MSDVFELGFRRPMKEIAIDDLRVTGQIPDWLEGVLIRNGPGTMQVGQQSYRHWFDGLAMLHRFEFKGGRVSYANRYLQSKSYQTAMEQGRITYSEFATDPCRSLFARVMAVFSPQISDSAKVSVGKFAETYMALAEVPIQVEFDPETLESVGVFNYEKGIVGQMTTAHPHYDDDGRSIYNLVTRYGRISQYRVYEMQAGREPRRLGSVPVKSPSYMHSFGMSPNYVLVTEFPLVVNPISLLLWLKPFIENFRWKPQLGTRVQVIDRRTGKLIRTLKTDAFFAFHHVNAFEEGDDIVMDLVAYENADIIKAYYLDRLSDSSASIPFGTLRRYRIPVKGGEIRKEDLSEACIELPRIDYARYNMRGDYRFVYGISIDPEQRQGFYNQLVRIDVEQHSHIVWRETGCYPGEPVFVAAPGSSGPDEGIVLSVVLDARHGTSFLLVLDARDFRELARAELPHPVMIGFHGEYFPE